VSATVDLGLATSSTSSTAPPAPADCAVADYSAHVAGELAVVRADRDRDDVDLAGHRVTELTPAERAA
jgi:hypothetical protein